MDIKIYSLIDPVTDEIRYIGQTCRTLNRRLNNHLWCDHNKYKTEWLNSLRKKGMRPIIKLIEKCNKDERFEREKYWINFYGKLYNLLNFTEDGSVGYKKEHNMEIMLSKIKGSKITDEHKKAISEANKGRQMSEKTRQKIRLANIGRKASAETRLKLSISHLGQIRSKEATERARLKQIGQKRTDETKKNISDSLKGRSISKEHRRNTRESIIRLQGRPVLQYTLTGEFIKEWRCASEAADYYKVDRSSLLNCCKGVYTKSAGFRWEYKNKDIV